MDIVIPIPCLPHVAKYIRYLLGVDEEGVVTLLGRGALRVFIKSFLTGKTSISKDARYGNPELYCQDVMARVPRKYLKEGGLFLDMRVVREINDFAVELMFEELSANAQLVRAAEGKEGSVKQMIYRFMDDIGAVESDGINYDALKKRLQRFESAKRQARRSITPLIRPKGQNSTSRFSANH